MRRPGAGVGEDLRREFLTLAADDARVRQELAKEGSLYEGYHPEMEAVHRRNAARLAALLDRGGWPLPSLVAKDGVEAAWLIVQHAIGEPDFQRRCLRSVSSANMKPGCAVPVGDGKWVESGLRTGPVRVPPK